MPNNQNNVNKDIKTLQDMIYASNYGLSRNFIEKNSDIVLKSNKAVNDTLVGFGVNNITNNSNSLQELTSLVAQSIKFKGNYKGDRTSNNAARKVLGAGDDDITGIKHITPIGNVDANETELVNEFSTMYQSFMTVTSEYRGVCDIIPEVGKAIQNITRDILSVSELSGRFLNKIYKEDGNTGSISDKDKKEINICTNLLQEEIIDKNNLEEKLKRWVYESLVCGVKPIAFIPYDYIIRQLNQINAKDANLKLDIGNISDKLKSGESYKICKNKNQEEEFYNVSVESSISDMFDETKLNGADRELKSEEYYDSLLTDDLVETFASDCEADFNKSFESLNFEKNKVKDDDIRHLQIYGERSTEANEQLELLESMTKQYKEVQDKAKDQTPEERKQNARKGLRTLARFIDEHIDVVKPGASSAFIANKIMNEKDRYSKFYNLGENYLMAEGLEKKLNKNKNIDKGERSDAGVFSYDSDSALGKECLIVPYAPEDVVPININGEYMGFYVLEYANENGPMWKRRRHVGSFTDYIKQQGLGDDKALMSGNGANFTSYNTTDPLETSLYSPLSLYNYAVTNFMDSESDSYDQRFDLMKIVTLRVLSHRLRDPDLAENKIFKDAVMTMLRNDILTRKKVQFTFIPPEYMVYMTYKTDDDGIPKSILDGTLLWAYMYISSIMSSVMIKMLKSADKEKYEVAVGLMKNVGYTVDELQRVLSTRSIYSGNMFSSLGNVIKNSGAYQRMIIPVINGNKLYDVSQIESVNNVSPDDDFTNKLLDSILSKVYINPGMRGSMDSLDFAHEYVYKNIEYRNNIMDAQNNYEKFITRILKILTNYSTLSTYNSKAETYDVDAKKERNSGDIDISRISVKLAISTMMSMTTVSEALDSAKNLASSIVEVYNLQDGSSVETARNTLFKRKIIEKYVNNVEWTDIEDILNKATEEAPNEVFKTQKLAKLDQKLQEDDLNDNSKSDAGGIGGENNTDLGSDDFSM